MEQSYIGKGTIYVEEIGANLGFLPLGNCPTLSLAFNEDKKELKDYQDAGGAVVNTVSRIDSVVASITTSNLEAANVALALRGLVTTIASTTISGEAHIGNVGALVKFDFLPDASVAPVVTGTGGTPVFVAGTDYELKNTGVKCIAGGAITAGLALEIDYTSLAEFEVEGLAASGKEYRVAFDGLNEAESGKPVSVLCHKVKFNPTQALDLISDEFGELQMSFDILKDPTITGSTKSKFVQIKTAQ